MTWWQQLDKTRGSRPRCVALMDGTREQVSARLTELAGFAGVVVSPRDRWMPRGLPVRQPGGDWDATPADEARLDQDGGLLAPDESNAIKSWWLKHLHPRANTPNWDVASTCTIGGRRALLLVEAKAHEEELSGALHGKPLKSDASVRSRENHDRIGRAIEDANTQLRHFTGLPWVLSRDRCYQLSNRFAMATKLTEMGYGVILVYLGFLRAGEMAPRTLLADDAHWRTVVLEHSRPVVPASAWDRELNLNGQPFVARIRSHCIEFAT